MHVSNSFLHSKESTILRSTSLERSIKFVSSNSTLLYRRANANTVVHMHAHTCTGMHIKTDVLTLTHCSPSLSLSHTHTHACARTRAHTHTHTPTDICACAHFCMQHSCQHNYITVPAVSHHNHFRLRGQTICHFFR